MNKATLNRIKKDLTRQIRNPLLLIAGGMSRQKFDKNIDVQKNTVNIINLNDILRNLQVHDGAHVLFKCYGMFAKIVCMLGHNPILSISKDWLKSFRL